MSGLNVKEVVKRGAKAMQNVMLEKLFAQINEGIKILRRY